MKFYKRNFTCKRKEEAGGSEEGDVMTSGGWRGVATGRGVRVILKL